MPHCQVSPCKDLLSSDGHPFHCLQSIVEVDADAPDSAIKIVMKNMRGNVHDWSIEAAEKTPRGPTEQAPTCPSQGPFAAAYPQCSP